MIGCRQASRWANWIRWTCPVSSFLVHPTQERWSMYLVEARVFPWVYWHRVLKGRLHESRFMKPFAPLVRWLGLALKES